MSVQTDQEAAKKEMKSWSLFKAVREIKNGGQLTGVEAEMHKEAEAENRSSMNGIGLPSWMTNKAEKRAIVDQGTSAIQPVAVEAFADALVEGALYNQVGLTNLGTLAADTVVPITGANAVAWAAENAAGTDTSADFTKITLSPNRINGYSNLSNVILMQNGTGAEAAIMRDMGRQIAAKIDANMFASTDAAAGPGCIVATTGVIDATTGTAFSDGTSVGGDMLSAIQDLANDHGLDGNLGFVNSFAGYSQIKKNAMVGSVSPLYQDDRLAGYPGWFSSAPASVSGGSASFDGMFGDFSRVYFATFGPTSILVDPYSAATENAVRLVVNQHYDWKLASGASFCKFTSLLA